MNVPGPDAAVINLPPIVTIVLSQLSQRRTHGEMNDGELNETLTRLERQELTPRGLVLTFHELSDGRMRFALKSRSTGEVQQTLEYPLLDLGGMLFEMQAAISRDGYYIAGCEARDALGRATTGPRRKAADASPVCRWNGGVGPVPRAGYQCAL